MMYVAPQTANRPPSVLRRSRTPSMANNQTSLAYENSVHWSPGMPPAAYGYQIPTNNEV